MTFILWIALSVFVAAVLIWYNELVDILERLF